SVAKQLLCLCLSMTMRDPSGKLSPQVAQLADFLKPNPIQSLQITAESADEIAFAKYAHEKAGKLDAKAATAALDNISKDPNIVKDKNFWAYRGVSHGFTAQSHSPNPGTGFYAIESVAPAVSGTYPGTVL